MVRSWLFGAAFKMIDSHARRAVFVHNGWRIADVMVDGQVPTPDEKQPKLSNPVSVFLSAYIPLVSVWQP